MPTKSLDLVKDQCVSGLVNSGPSTAAMVFGFCGVLIGLLALHFAMEAYLVMFGAGMASGISWQTVGWLFSLAKRRAARLAGAV